MNERQLRAFLPAVLEVQQTPPLPYSRMILWAILAISVGAIIWACVGRVDIVAVAQGRIIPDGQVKTIQPLEAGVVKAIHVDEGQQVAAGELLIELDPTATDAELERLHQEQQALRGDRARLRAILEASAPDCDPHASCARPEMDCAAATGSCALNRRRLSQVLDAYQARLQALREQSREKQAAHLGLRRRIMLLDATMPIIRERAQAQQTLYRKRLASRAAWLELEQQRIGQVKQRDILRANVDEATAGIAHISGQIHSVQAGFRRDTLRQLDEVERRLTALLQELRKAGQRNRLQRLRAPIAGTIQQLAVHTLGGVVSPAQVLMRIVPRKQALQVEAWVRNQDIGHIHAGQVAEIKVDAFPFTRYGVIRGQVIRVSRDTVTDERHGLAYLAQVRMNRRTIRVAGEDLNLGPGMAVSVEVREGQRRMIEFLLDPLLRYRDEAMRER